MLSRIADMRLVADAGKRFVAAEHFEHLEDAWRGRPAGQGGAQRLGHLADFAAGLVGEAAHGSLERFWRPWRNVFESRQESGENFPPGSIEKLRGLLIHRQGPFGEEEGRAVEELDQRLGALF